MSVTGKMSRSSLGQVMPVHAEPLGFTNASFRAVNQVTFSYRTNTDAAAVLLPTELEIDENPKISVMFLSYGFSSVGPFREYIHIIHARFRGRSEEHTSELQSHSDLVCRLLLEKKKKPRGILTMEQKK